MSSDSISNLAVLTSGGDAQGMNAAVRSVVRTCLHHGIKVFAVHEGYKGLVAGGGFIREMGSGDVGGILQQGGSIIGSARSPEFRTERGRRTATRHLVEHDIDALVVIGGDGSLTGADVLRCEWSDHLAALVDAGDLTAEQAAAHPKLRLAGLVGSIDNDMFGTDMTIGADSALHRIVEAVDAIHTTAASHQRSFVVEVMGRHCGYLALMAAVATGSNWVFIPECPPAADDWEEAMCEALSAGRRIGRRQHIVIVAEGAQDRHGQPITSDRVKQVLEDGLGEDTRVTILGHVQRGGRPSAFDRNLSTVLGRSAVETLRRDEHDEPQLVGIREHQVVTSPLMEMVEKTHKVAEHIEQREYDRAMELRGGSFAEMLGVLRTLTRAKPHDPQADADPRRLRLAVLHAGGVAPGMNTAARVAVRLGLDRGHTLLGVRNGFVGLRDGDLQEMEWMSVTEWVAKGGAELGTSRWVPDEAALEEIARQVTAHELDGLLMIGGWHGYQGAYALHCRREELPALGRPIVCLPASIDNNLPMSELAIGADTALNAIVADVDKIKQSAVAQRRCFVVEVMGRDCGYLALGSGLATGAERVYLPEEGVGIDDLQRDVEALTEGFRSGKRLGLVIRNENADAFYTTDFIARLFEREGGDLFDVREAILGHIQTGGDPSPFDRIQATRLASWSIDRLIREATSDEPRSAFIGLHRGRVRFTDLADFPDLVEPEAQRPREQRWMALRPLADIMAGRGARPG